MHRFKIALLIALVAVLLLIGLPVILPASAGPAIFYVLIILLDVYLWTSVKHSLSGMPRAVATIMRVLYWLPLMMLVATAIGIYFSHFGLWPTALRVWVFGILGLAYVSKLIPALFLLMADLLRLVKFAWSCAGGGCRGSDFQRKGISRSRFLRNIGVLGGGLIFSSMLAGMIRWVYDFRIHEVKIPLLKLPDAFDGYRIVQISDLHLGSWTSEEPLREAVGLVNSLNPDMVVFTGDLVNYQTREAVVFESVLAGITATDGVAAVLGNHDYGDYVRWNSTADKQQNMNQLVDLYQRLGWRLLRNESMVVVRGSAVLALIGVENWGANRRFPRKGNLEKAKLGLPDDVGARILLSHDPTHWQYKVSGFHPDIGLTLAGHTHGMQVGIETKNFRWSPAQYIYRYWAGIYNHGSQYLYVNRGLGHIGYPGRIGILPEITLIELVSGN